jgi:pyridoxal 5'-phosphate synthase pdxT subunit
VTVGVLALQGDVREHVATLDALHQPVRLVRRPEDLDGLRGLILPGGESTTLSLLLDSSGMREPLARLLGNGLPVFGTCAGMILLATDVLDGRDDQRPFGLIDLAVRRNGFGRQRASFECDLTVPGMDGEPVHAVFIRAPVVERAGPGVEVLATLPATSAESDPQPVLCRQGTVLVSSFHPELTADRRLHGLFVAMMEGRDGGHDGRAVTNQERRR